MVTISKRNHNGEETWRYEGEIVARGATWMRIRALFNRPDVPFHGILLRDGDPFVETFYDDRWYNVFEIHDKDDGRIKGWYCNVTRPAFLSEELVAFEDTYLDLLVYPDGRQLVLDEDEFEAAKLDEETRRSSLEGLAQLRAAFQKELKAPA